MYKTGRMRPALNRLPNGTRCCFIRRHNITALGIHDSTCLHLLDGSEIDSTPSSSNNYRDLGLVMLEARPLLPERNRPSVDVFSHYDRLRFWYDELLAEPVLSSVNS